MTDPQQFHDKFVRKLEWIDEQMVTTQSHGTRRTVADRIFVLQLVPGALQHMPGAFWASKHQNALLYQPHPRRPARGYRGFHPLEVRIPIREKAQC